MQDAACIKLAMSGQTEWIQGIPKWVRIFENVRDYQALSDACAKLLLAEDAWTDRFWEFVGLRLYCERCWRREKRLRGHRQLSKGRRAPEAE